MITFGVTTHREWVYVRQLDPRLWPFKPVVPQEETQTEEGGCQEARPQEDI